MLSPRAYALARAGVGLTFAEPERLEAWLADLLAASGTLHSHELAIVSDRVRGYLQVPPADWADALADFAKRRESAAAEPKPAAHPLAMRAIYERTFAALRPCVVGVPDGELALAVLWALGTWGLPAPGDLTTPGPEMFPRLRVDSQSGTGKTQLMHTLGAFCFRFWSAESLTTAAHREQLAQGGTLLLDELDNYGLDRDEAAPLRRVLNAGYWRRGKATLRGEVAPAPGLPKVPGNHEVFVFCPVMFAGIGKVPEPTRNRCITLTLPPASALQTLNVAEARQAARAAAAELQPHLLARREDIRLAMIFRTAGKPKQAASAAQDVQQRLAALCPTPRTRDTCLPLVALAHALGRDVLETAFAAVGVVERAAAGRSADPAAALRRDLHRYAEESSAVTVALLRLLVAWAKAEAAARRIPLADAKRNARIAFTRLWLDPHSLPTLPLAPPQCRDPAREALDAAVEGLDPALLRPLGAIPLRNFLAWAHGEARVERSGYAPRLTRPVARGVEWDRSSRPTPQALGRRLREAGIESRMVDFRHRAALRSVGGARREVIPLTALTTPFTTPNRPPPPIPGKNRRGGGTRSGAKR